MFGIDWTVRVGDLLVIGGFITAIITLFSMQKSDIRVIRHDLKYVQEHLATLNESFTQLGQILTQVAVQDSRLGMMEKSIDELRHGQGFVRLSKTHLTEN